MMRHHPNPAWWVTTGRALITFVAGVDVALGTILLVISRKRGVPDNAMWWALATMIYAAIYMVVVRIEAFTMRARLNMRDVGGSLLIAMLCITLIQLIRYYVEISHESSDLD